jgi:hypothetical protein
MCESITGIETAARTGGSNAAVSATPAAAWMNPRLFIDF